MAQSALTVLAISPTPPTNFGSGYVNAGKFTAGPPHADYPATVYNDPYHPGVTNPTGPLTGSGNSTSTAPPFLDDGTAGSGTAFAAPSSGAAAEGAGTEVVVTQTYNPAVYNPAGPLQTFSDLGNYVGLSPTSAGVTTSTPNQQHASSLSPVTNPTLSSISPTTAASGASGTVAVTATTVGATRQSVIFANGVAVPTTFVSSTSLTANIPKKTSAGTWPITIVTGGVVVTASQTFTWT